MWCTEGSSEISGVMWCTEISSEISGVRQLLESWLEVFGTERRKSSSSGVRRALATATATEEAHSQAASTRVPILRASPGTAGLSWLCLSAAASACCIAGCMGQAGQLADRNVADVPRPAHPGHLDLVTRSHHAIPKMARIFGYSSMGARHALGQLPIRRDYSSSIVEQYSRRLCASDH